MWVRFKKLFAYGWSISDILLVQHSGCVEVRQPSLPHGHRTEFLLEPEHLTQEGKEALLKHCRFVTESKVNAARSRVVR